MERVPQHVFGAAQQASKGFQGLLWRSFRGRRVESCLSDPLRERINIEVCLNLARFVEKLRHADG